MRTYKKRERMRNREREEERERESKRLSKQPCVDLITPIKIIFHEGLCGKKSDSCAALATYKLFESDLDTELNT